MTIKRISSFLLALLMVFNLCVPAYAAEDVPAISLSVDKTEAVIGDTVTVTISCEAEITGLQTWGMDLYLDPAAYKLTDAVIEDGYGGMFAVATDTIQSHSCVNISAISTNTKYALTIPQGEVAVLTFEVIGESTGFFELKEVDANIPNDAETIRVVGPTEGVQVITRAEAVCAHAYVSGVCTQCGEADPDYVVPSVDVTLSLSRDAEYMTGPETGEVMAFKKITVPYFDLALYGLEEYYFVSESYGDDGDGLPGSDMEPGTAAYADGKVTLLHLYLYALEVYYCGVDPQDAGKGYLYNEGLVNTEVFTISGGVGSSFLNQFWGGDCNLNYYVNYEYPLASDGWGATCDQILLRDGDMVTLGNFTGWSFYGDPYSIFNYMVADNSAPEQGEAVTLTLYYAGSNLGTTAETAQNLNTYCVDVYCVPANQVTDADVTSWTYLGTSDENGQLVVDTSDMAPGKYILSIPGQPGEYYPDEICSTPGGMVLTVTEPKECQHNYVAGVCDKCGADDPDYVAPSNDAVVFEGEMPLTGNKDITITELILKDAKDKVLAAYVGDYAGSWPLNIFLDGDKVSVGDTFEFGFTAAGDDKDEAAFRIITGYMGNSFTIQSYGYAMGSMQIQDSSGSTTVAIRPNLFPVNNFSLNNTELNMTVDGEETLSISTSNGDVTSYLKSYVEWTSSNTAVATVEGGKVVAVAPGTATITATVGTKSASCEVTVAEPVNNDYVFYGSETGMAVPGDADITVTELSIKNGKDKVLAVDTSSSSATSLSATIFLYETVQDGEIFQVGYKAVGDDVDTIIVENDTYEIGKLADIPNQSFPGIAQGTMKIKNASHMAVEIGVNFRVVTSFGLDQTTLNLAPGAEGTLALKTNLAAYLNNYLANCVEWTSSNTAVATVEGGKVVAVAPGTATITAAVGTKTATCEVTVESGNVTVYSGELTHYSTNLDAYVTEFYVVDGKNFVLGHSVDDSQAYYGNITTTVFVDGDQIKVGDTVNLGYTMGGEDADQVKSVSGTAAKIQSYGYYMDQMRITLTDYYTISNRFDIYPVSKFELSDVQVEPETETTLALTLDSHFDRWSTPTLTSLVEWTSSDESVVTVEGGKLIAKEIGTATITAKLGTAAVAKTATCTVTVACDHNYFNGICTKCSAEDPDYVAIEVIALSSPSMRTETDAATGETVNVLSLVAGGSEKVTATVNEGATQGIIWSSENEGVAKVDENGVVTAVSNGTTTITATAGDTARTFAARNNPVIATLKVTVSDLPDGEYYTVTLAEDKTVVAGETIEVPVTVGHSNYLNYNAWDMTFTYDSSALKLTTASSGDTFTVTASGNTIRVQGYGADMAADTTAFTLTFEALKAATTELTLDSAKVDNAGHAVGNDAPEATVIDGLTVLTVTGYPVTLPEGFQGEGVAAPGKDYTFSAPQDYYDYTVEIQVGGEIVDVTPTDGTWTIPGANVTGEIVITRTDKTGKTFSVDLGEYMDGETAAQHGTDYEATLVKEDGYTYSVTVKIGGETYTGAQVSGNTYTIPGGDITGEIQFLVTRNVVASTDLSVEFTGTGAGAAEGNATSVKNGEDYVLTLTMAKGYTYIVRVGGQEVAPNAEGKYVIENVTAALTIEIEKLLDLEGKVSVKEYVNLDGKTVFLVLVEGELDEDSYYTYDGKAMYYSYVYNAWAYLTVESGSFQAADASQKVAAAAGAKMTISSAKNDVNNTGVVDINDAQLAYDVYKGSYADIASIGMAKYLWADVNGDMKVDVTDAQMVVASIK